MVIIKKGSWIIFLLTLFAGTTAGRAEAPAFWINPALPEKIRQTLPDGLPLAEELRKADCVIDMVNTVDTGDRVASAANMTPAGADSGRTQWVYALVAPFPTATDAISSETLQALWNGTPTETVATLTLGRETRRVFADRWGKQDSNTVKPRLKKDLLSATWEESKTWAIVPFDELDPRWKVIRVDGVSPLDFDFDPAAYPLTVTWQVRPLKRNSDCGLSLPSGNFDPEKLTTLTLTGTTAMVRNLAFKIEEKGLDYPLKNIGETLSRSDITHISNEAPFTPDCPPAVPLRREARFCSDPSYLEILHQAGADVVEMTGNHLLDWGQEPFIYTLDLYQEDGLTVYGGGLDAAAGQEPVFFEHHGNRIALLGCNAIGPEQILATAKRPGPAPCDQDQLHERISILTDEGWQVVVTFQHLEYPYYDVPPAQSHDFYKAAEAGAVIVSGSQAHIPQGMTFIGDSFIHFGLGNLLFDQMSDLERDSFFDRHYFYDGRYISTVLETIRLEDYSQPRFLTRKKRADFLNLMFDTCTWQRAFE